MMRVRCDVGQITLQVKCVQCTNELLTRSENRKKRERKKEEATETYDERNQNKRKSREQDQKKAIIVINFWGVI